MHCIRQCIASESISHQPTYCIIVEQYVTSIPRVNGGEQRVALDLSSESHQTVRCIRQSVASDSPLHQTVHGIRWYIASGSILYQCRGMRHVSTKGQWQAAYCIRVKKCVASDSASHQRVYRISQRIVLVPSNTSR